jgi:putative spermidine/putrescine transport system permease protein
LSDHSSLRTPSQRIAWTATIVISTLVFIFLIAPILAIMPLSFSSGSYLTYPLPGLSLRWYDDFINSPRWMNSLKNSMIIGVASTLLSMVLGTLAALGLAQWKSRSNRSCWLSCCRRSSCPASSPRSACISSSRRSD